MPATILGEHALTIPSSGTRPTGSAGMIRHNTTNNSYEGYHNLTTGVDNWYGLGGKQLIARSVRGDAWNSFDMVWGYSGSRYVAYEVYWTFADPLTTNSRVYCQVYDPAGNLWNNSGASGYSYIDNWAASNDGTDYSGTNFNSVNSNCNSSIPITNWYSDSSYWSAANGESTQTGTLNIYSGLPSSRGNNWPMYDGTYVHYSGVGGMVQGRFGGMIFQFSAAQASTNYATNLYPIRGLRFGYLDGYTNRSGAITAIVTVYGLTGTEERDL